jgi:hypothetical protein
MFERILREFGVSVEHRDIEGYRQDEPIEMMGCQ